MKRGGSSRGTNVGVGIGACVVGRAKTSSVVCSGSGAKLSRRCDATFTMGSRSDTRAPLGRRPTRTRTR